MKIKKLDLRCPLWKNSRRNMPSSFISLMFCIPVISKRKTASYFFRCIWPHCY